MALLYFSPDDRLPAWEKAFSAAGEVLLAGQEAVTDPGAVTHLVCWDVPDLSAYPNLRVVISKGAGVDHFPPMPPGVKLCRMLAPGIDHLVRDWVIMATLALHRDLPAYLQQAQSGDWTAKNVPLAQDRRIGIMGMGRIGALCANSLMNLGFPVSGWSRSGHDISGALSYTGDQLGEFLAQSDLLICLLPLTEATRGILGPSLFRALPKGALLVHAGRGSQLDMDALHEALDQGQLAAAMLDVTNPEPLPQDHWAWSDTRVIITPHIGARTPGREGAVHALAILKAEKDGTALPGEIHSIRGY
ncbi:MAG: 2-hydroxyacid dehydrogenase [Mangrovicoccus sp.]